MNSILRKNEILSFNNFVSQTTGQNSKNLLTLNHPIVFSYPQRHVLAYSVRILATNFYPMVTEEVFKHRMALIELLVSELNELCKRYVDHKDEFKDIDRIPIVFSSIRDQGI